jgi:hemolysin D
MKSVTRADSALQLMLELQAPSAAVLNAPLPRSARGTVWAIGSLVLASGVALGVIRVDQVVTASGKIVPSVSAQVVQPLDTAIVRSIDVREGDRVHAGQILARLDPTFAAADLGSQRTQVGMLESQVARLQAELGERMFRPELTERPSGTHKRGPQRLLVKTSCEVSKLSAKDANEWIRIDWDIKPQILAKIPYLSTL